MAKGSTHDESLLTKKYLDLVHDYLELQRLRVEVKKAEFQKTKKETRRREEAK